jgi:ribonuclease D
VSTFIRNTHYPERISKEEINELPIRTFPGTIRLIQTHEELVKIIPALKRETILGFDTETKPTFRKGVIHNPALLQLATGRTVYLLRLNLLEHCKELLPILASPTCLKVGVAVKDDIIGLQKINPFTAAGFVDIASLSKELGIHTIGLRSLTAIFLKFRISKKAQVSNWARKELSSSQLQYAATDAWVSRKIFLKLRRFNRLTGTMDTLQKEQFPSEKNKDTEARTEKKQGRKGNRRKRASQAPRHPASVENSQAN